MRARNAILVALVSSAAACGGEDSDPKTGLEKGSFGDTCQTAEDCVGLEYYQLHPGVGRDTVECESAAGPKVCRFHCVSDLTAEACATLGGACLDGVCRP